jgi:hypothetical protein
VLFIDIESNICYRQNKSPYGATWVDIDQANVSEIINVEAIITSIQSQIIPAILSSLYYQQVQDEGIDLPQRYRINFIGAGVTVIDAGEKTVVTIPGGGGSSDDALNYGLMLMGG